MIVSMRVSYHSETVPVKSGAAEEAPILLGCKKEFESEIKRKINLEIFIQKSKNYLFEILGISTVSKQFKKN
mgnify:CR=1 FL=1